MAEKLVNLMQIEGQSHEDLKKTNHNLFMAYINTHDRLIVLNMVHGTWKHNSSVNGICFGGSDNGKLHSGV